jgi:hypothetical protein
VLLKNALLFVISLMIPMVATQSCSGYAEPTAPDLLYNGPTTFEFGDIKSQIHSDESCFGTPDKIMYKPDPDEGEAPFNFEVSTIHTSQESPISDTQDRTAISLTNSEITNMVRKLCWPNDDGLICTKMFWITGISSGDSALCYYNTVTVPDVLFDPTVTTELNYFDIQSRINSNPDCWGTTDKALKWILASDDP